MNYLDKLKQFEIKTREHFNFPESFKVHSILSLPYADPIDTFYNFEYNFKQLAEKNMLTGLSCLTKITKKEFDSVTDFSRNYNNGSSFDLDSVNHYIEAVFQQWKVYFDNNDIDISVFEEAKNKIKLDIDELLKPFKRINDFVEKYSIAEKFYIRNKNDLDVAPILYEELIQVIEEFDDVSQPENLRFFFACKEENLLKKHFENYQLIIEDMRESIIQIHPEEIASIGQKFILHNNLDKNEIVSFLTSKSFEEDINVQIKFTPSQPIQEMIYFKDNSVIVKERGKEYRIANGNEFSRLTDQVVISAIDYTLRKKPKMAELFKEIYEEESPSAEMIFDPINTYINNEQILKNANFDFNIFKYKGTEEIDDAMNAVILDYKVIKYANSILSNKYKHLMTDASKASFKELFNSGITESQIQTFVGKKLAALKTPEDFTSFMTKVANQFSGFNIETLTTKLENSGITPILDSNDIYVFEVTSFEHSKELGSSSWCISRSENYFNNYTSSGERQFFIYDFNKKETDNDSMIGITIKTNGTFRTQHLKNDDFISPNDFLNDIRHKLILKDIKAYDLDDSVKKELGINEEDNIELKNKSLKIGI